MPPVSVRPRRRAVLALAVTTVVLTACRLDGGSTLPPIADPATQTYDASTGVTISAMTKISPHLYTQDFVVGTGGTVAVGDSISVYYVGALVGGFQFDKRVAPSAPFAFRLDSNTVIKGWVGGLPGMRVGGKRKIVFSPALGYGYNVARDAVGNILIPANSVLVFDVEVTARVPGA
jgi:FKBP-type peptidyl-prolyl cis-trans isomerase FkpA